MNAQQRKTVNLVREKAWRIYGRGKDNEFKRFDVKEENDGYVSIRLEIGLVNDDGTMASMFARDRHLFFVGPRGGLRAINREGKLIRGKRVWAENRSTKGI